MGGGGPGGSRGGGWWGGTEGSQGSPGGGVEMIKISEGHMHKLKGVPNVTRR